MALLDILTVPDPRLRRKASPVDCVDDDLRGLVDDMFETMYEAPGIGLAAVQINVLKHVIVIDVSEDRDQPLCLINSEIVEASGTQICEEGCLSVPEVYADVERAEQITIRALDRDGKAFKLEADGLLAVCIQHEIDHLDGKLFVDYLSPLKRARIEKRLAKQQRASTQGDGGARVL